MSKARKSDICPANVGELFTDGKDYFTLLSCETEPSASMRNLQDDTRIGTRLISQFANFVMLKPVRPIEKPRKPRADKGGTHRVGTATIQPQKETATLEKAAELNDVVIHTPAGDETDYVVTIRGCEGRARELGLAVMEAVNQWGGNISELSEYGRKQIQTVLGKEKIKKEGK